MTAVDLPDPRLPEVLGLILLIYIAYIKPLQNLEMGQSSPQSAPRFLAIRLKFIGLHFV